MIALTADAAAAPPEEEVGSIWYIHARTYHLPPASSGVE